jgi:hypothetical protein
LYTRLQNFTLISLLLSSQLAFAGEPSTVKSRFQTPLDVYAVNIVLQQQSPTLTTISLHANDTEQFGEKDWGGAMAEVGTILLLGTASYYAGGSSMERDFDYDIEGNVVGYFHDRLFDKEYWKFDDNSMGMNWGHAYAGMIYHQAFRNHNFNYYESTLATFLTSTAWEAVVEYKEVVSINDQIVTTWGGAVLGESFFQLSEMLATKQGWVPYTFETLFNPAEAIGSWFGTPKKSRFNRQKVNDIFSVYISTMDSSNDIRDLDKSILTFGLNASVDSRQGQYDNLSGTPTLVEMNAEVGISELGLEDFQLSSTLLLGGYYRHVPVTNMTREKWQKTFFIGPSVGIEYASFGAEEDDEDFYAVVNVLGIAMGGDWQRNDLRMQLSASIYADFSMVKPFASQGVENYRDFFWNSKSALWENGYAYALGHTANFTFEASYRHLSFGLSLRSQRWDSIDNKKIERDTDWNPNVKDLDFKDTRDRYQSYINYEISPIFTLGLHHEQIHRSGEFIGIDDPTFYAQAEDVESRSWIQLNYRY